MLISQFYEILSVLFDSSGRVYLAYLHKILIEISLIKVRTAL